MDPSAIVACELPPQALLCRYNRHGGYTDCYRTVIARPVWQAEYVEAFYTTAVFRTERLILRLLRLGGTDAQARELAEGRRSRYAAWSVEDRSENQLLMCDAYGSTRSWLMTEPCELDGHPATRLYFGSAVVPRAQGREGRVRIGFMYRALMGFHKLYSVILLAAARRQLS